MTEEPSHNTARSLAAIRGGALLYNEKVPSRQTARSLAVGKQGSLPPKKHSPPCKNGGQDAALPAPACGNLSQQGVTEIHSLLSLRRPQGRKIFRPYRTPKTLRSQRPTLATTEPRCSAPAYDAKARSALARYAAARLLYLCRSAMQASNS